MRLKLDADVGTTEFYWPDVMGEDYDPPGVRVHVDENGERHFSIKKDVGEAMKQHGEFGRKVADYHRPDHAGPPEEPGSGDDSSGNGGDGDGGGRDAGGDDSDSDADADA